MTQRRGAASDRRPAASRARQNPLAQRRPVQAPPETRAEDVCAGATRSHDQVGGGIALDCARQAVCDGRRGDRFAQFDVVGLTIASATRRIAGPHRSPGDWAARASRSERRCHHTGVNTLDEFEQ